MVRGSFSLAEAPPESDYRIARFRYGLVRDYCWNLGLREGATVRCCSLSPRAVELELDGGRHVVLDSSYARFVELAPDGGPARPRSDAWRDKGGTTSHREV